MDIKGFFRPDAKKLLVLFIFLFTYFSIITMLLLSASYSAAVSASAGEGAGRFSCTVAFYEINSTYLGTVFWLLSAGISTFCYGLAPQISIPVLLIYWYVLASVISNILDFACGKICRERKP